jgi:hypothetical protein
MILDFHRQGLSVSAIARRVGIDRKTVRKYIERGLEPPSYGPRKPRARRLERFEVYLRERVIAYPGLTASRLLREIKELGYAGGYTAVTDFLREGAAGAGGAIRGPLRDPAGGTGTSRFCPLRGDLRRRARRGAESLAVLAGARLQPADLGTLCRPPRPANGAALPHGCLRGLGRGAARDPLRPDEDRGHRRGRPTSPGITASIRRPAGPTGPRPRARSSGRSAISARTPTSPAHSAISTT